MGFARTRGALAGVVRSDGVLSICTFLSGASRLIGCGLAAFERVELRSDPLLGDLKASFHCFTSSTASLKFAGGFDTGASLLRDPTIQACLSNFRAETRNLGSF